MDTAQRKVLEAYCKGKSDDYLTGFADGVDQALTELDPVLNQELAINRRGAEILREFIAERNSE